MTVIQALIDLGLSQSQARVLAAMAEQQQAATTIELADSSGVPRTNIYRVVGELEEKGLVTRVPTVSVARWACDWPSIINQLDTRVQGEFAARLNALAILREATAEKRGGGPGHIRP